MYTSPNVFLPPLQPSVVSLLDHTHEVVRKKAVVALHRCYQLNPSCIGELYEVLRRVLCDKASLAHKPQSPSLPTLVAERPHMP